MKHSVEHVLVSKLLSERKVQWEAEEARNCVTSRTVYISDDELIAQAVPQALTIAIVQVEAAALNYFDCLQARGFYQDKPELPFIPGAEFSGVICEIRGKPPASSSALRAGDRVLGFTRRGAFSRRIAVPLDALLPIPNKMPFQQAAALGIVYATSHLAILQRGKVHRGEVVLVLAAAGGVGFAAVQLALSVGARVIAAVGSDPDGAKQKMLEKAGVEAVLNYQRGGNAWIDRVKEITAKKGVDVVFDPVGGNVGLAAGVKCLGWGGRFLVVGFASGAIPKFTLNVALLKNLSILGVYWGESVRRDPRLYHSTFNDLFDLFQRDLIHPQIHSTLPFSQVRKAMFLLENRKVIGKLILVPSNPDRSSL